MSDGTSIEWTDASLNPLRVRHRQTGKVGWHCEHKSEGCRFCYAEPINRRLGTGLDYKPGHLADVEAFLDEKTLLQPLKWKRPRKIFLGSMTDLFGDWVTDEQLDRIFAVMALCPQHTFQVLTKRPERMRAYMSASDVEKRIARASVRIKPLSGGAGRHDIEIQVDATEGLAHWPLPNVWLGVSCEDQATADERIPLLLETPASVRFISAEPLLGPIDLTRFDDRESGTGDVARWRNALDGSVRVEHPAFPDALTNRENLDWVIVGGESGPHARPMHPDWARSLRDQCAAAGVAYFFKQFGEWAPFTGHPIEQDCAMSRGGFETITFKADGFRVGRIGKKRAGRLLDGVEHSAFPEVRA